MSAAAGDIVISGGGIGGLACALACARAGMKSRVLERRGAFGEDGAGIQIGPNGTRLLDMLGVAQRLAPAAATPQTLDIRDAVRGGTLATYPLGLWLEARHGAPYWTLHRRDLHAALLDAAAANGLIAIETGAGVVGHRADGDAVAVEAADGRVWRGDVLVVAEGLWSPTRQRLAAAATLRPTGRRAARTTIAADRVPAALRTQAVGLWLGAQTHVVHYPVRNGAEWALVFVTGGDDALEDWSAEVPADAVRARAAELAPALRELIAAGDQWRQWSLQALSGEAPAAQGRVALLGDAAHPVLPFLAQGAVLALEDACMLATALDANRADPAAGLSSYAQLRHDRVRRVQAASARNGRIYHLSGPAAAARNTALRLIPGERAMAAFDWLYGWRGGA